MKHRKITSILLVIAMIMTLLPMAVLPASASTSPTALPSIGTITIDPATGATTMGTALDPTAPSAGTKYFWALTEKGVDPTATLAALTTDSTMDEVEKALGLKAGFEVGTSTAVAALSAFITKADNGRWLVVLKGNGEWGTEKLYAQGSKKIEDVTFPGAKLDLTSITPTTIADGNPATPITGADADAIEALAGGAGVKMTRTGRQVNITLPSNTQGFKLTTGVETTVLGKEVSHNKTEGSGVTAAVANPTIVEVDLTDTADFATIADGTADGTATKEYKGKTSFVLTIEGVDYIINIEVLPPKSKPLFEFNGTVTLDPDPSTPLTFEADAKFSKADGTSLVGTGTNNAYQDTEGASDPDAVWVDLTVPSTAKVEIATVAGVTAAELKSNSSYVTFEAAKIILDTSSLPSSEDGVYRFEVTYTESGKDPRSYKFTVKVNAAITDTATLTFTSDVSSASVTPSGAAPKGSTITIEVDNGTKLVDVKTASAATQKISVSGVDSTYVKGAKSYVGHATTAKFDVDTAGIALKGGERKVDLTVSQPNMLPITYTVIIKVKPMAFAVNSDTDDENGLTATGVVNENGKVEVTVSGTATDSGTHTLKLTSTDAGSFVPANYEFDVVAETTYNDTYNFTIILGSTAIDDLAITFDPAFDSLSVNAVEAIAVGATTSNWSKVKVSTFVDAKYPEVATLSKASYERLLIALEDASLTAGGGGATANESGNRTAIETVLATLGVQDEFLAAINANHNGTKWVFKADAAPALFEAAGIDLTTGITDKKDILDGAKTLFEDSKKVYTVQEIQEIIDGVVTALAAINTGAGNDWADFKVSAFAKAGIVTTGYSVDDIKDAIAAFKTAKGSAATIAEINDILTAIDLLKELKDQLAKEPIKIAYQGLGVQNSDRAAVANKKVIEEKIDPITLGVAKYKDFDVSASAIQDEDDGSYTLVYTIKSGSTDVLVSDDLDVIVEEELPTNPYDILELDIANLTGKVFEIPLVSKSSDDTRKVYLVSKVKTIVTSTTTAAISEIDSSAKTYKVTLTSAGVDDSIELTFTEQSEGITANADAIIPIATDKGNVSINLSKGLLVLPDTFEYAAYSIDGGTKWKNGTIKANDVSKFFKKDLTLWIATKPIEKATKAPPEDSIIKFDTILAAPKVTEKYTVNYSVLKSDSSAGEWVISTDKGSYVAPEANIEIAREIGKKQYSEWGMYDYDGTSGTNGISVAELGANGKPVKMKYAIRIAATESGGVWTAPSAIKAVAVTGLQKAIKEPKVKTDKTTKTMTLPLKAGQSYKIGSGNVTNLTDKATPTVKPGDVVTLWTTATAKKPASEPVVFTIK